MAVGGVVPGLRVVLGVLLLGTAAAQVAASGPGAGVVDVRDFGARGDGVADDYEAIQAAVARINAQGGGTLRFPKGVYRVARHRIHAGPHANGVTNFAFKDCVGLTIEGNGSKIDLDGDWVRSADYFNRTSRSWHDAISLAFINCTGLVVRDLEIDGNADLTTQEARAEGPSHGIVLAGCRDVLLDNLYVHHMQADGLYVDQAWDPPGQKSSYRVTRNLRVSNSRFNNNARQGMSIIQAIHATFVNCEFSYTGQTGKYGGHSPQAGVDVEPNRFPGHQGKVAGDDFTGDLVFSGCRFVENFGFEYVGTNPTSTPHPVVFIGCTFADKVGAFRPAVVPATAQTRFLGCSFDNVQVVPFLGVAGPPTASVEIAYSRFSSADPRQRVLLYGKDKGDLLVHHNEFRFIGDGTAGAAYRLYLQGGGRGEFLENLVWIDGREHAGKARDLKFLLQGLRRVEGNRWQTDLARPGDFFDISLDHTTDLGRGDHLQGQAFRSSAPRRPAAKAP